VKAEIVVSAAALNDIESIIEHLTREAGPNVAAKYRRRLLRIFALLHNQPGLGARRPKLGRGVRLSVMAPYLVFYRHSKQTATIPRVLHGSRKISTALLR
jgi:plasmid stabilization system protein ParE